jgi:diadenosine tetraphosphate (Ap4A) HIT family hydrolase
MPASSEISEFIQERLAAENLEEVTAVMAADWLDQVGLLADSPDRPGRNLRALLRGGQIHGAVQRPPKKNGRWFIRLECPFCRRISESGVKGLATSFLDAFPSAPGHRLVIPTRHVKRIGALTPKEWSALFEMVREVGLEVSGDRDFEGLNIGLNDGLAAGQTVGHVHVHVIPRRMDDVPDPRGGVRWVLPATADYWSERKFDE